MDIANDLRKECEDRAPTGELNTDKLNKYESGETIEDNIYTWRDKNLPLTFPDLVLVDGNGILHHREFGLACHLGTLLKVSTIGVGKSLLMIDGMDKKWLKDEIKKKYFDEKLPDVGSKVILKGSSGKVYGVAIRLGKKGVNPTFISVGYGINLESAERLVLDLSIYRVPEPIRQADFHSRERIRLGMI